MLIKALRDDMMNAKGKARETHNRFGNEESLEDWLADNEGNGTWGGTSGVSNVFMCSPGQHCNHF